LRAQRDSIGAKLLGSPRATSTPFIDRTLYTGWNAMAISAYLETARVLRLEGVEEFALKSLNRLLNEAWDRREGPLSTSSPTVNRPLNPNTAPIDRVPRHRSTTTPSQ